MSKVLVISRREYNANVRTKAFMISLVLMPIMMGGGFIAQKMLRGRTDIGDKRVVIIDGTGKLTASLIEAAAKRNETEIYDYESHKQVRSKYVLEPGPPWPVDDEKLLALSTQVRNDEIAGFAVIRPDAIGEKAPPMKLTDSATSPSEKTQNADAVRFYSQGVSSDRVGDWLEQSISGMAQVHRLTDAGLDPLVVAKATRPVLFKSLGLYTRDSTGQVHEADESSRMVTFFVPMAIMMLMFMSLMMSQTLLSSALEEKQQRIAEVLLGSVSPFQLMLGKLFGNVAVALTITAVYMFGGYFMLRHYGYQGMVPSNIVAWFVVFQILGVLIYGSLFISIGAACTELKEAQNLLMPVMLLVVFPMFVWFNVLQDPTSRFAVMLSLFPPATPMLMPMRLTATSGIPIWQPLLGVGLVLIASMICVFAAGRVYRIGILSQGKAPRLHELARWAMRG